MNTQELIKKKKDFLWLVENIRNRNALVTEYDPSVFAPGLLDGLDKVGASYDERTGIAVIKTEVQGTLYEGRTPRIESLSVGSALKIVREPSNTYNSNNLSVRNMKNESLGNLSSEIGNALSPLMDEKAAAITKASVSYVEPRSARGPQAKKAILYTEFQVKLQQVTTGNKNGCTVLFLGGDQVRVWVQKLTVMQCDIPMEHAGLLFEAYNRMCDEYRQYDPNDDLSYLGLDGLRQEVLDANRKRVETMKNGKDYSAPEKDDGDFVEWILHLAKTAPGRYGALKQYIENVEESSGIETIFRAHEIDSKTYYWVDRTQVDSATYERECGDGFSHWYDVMELYGPEGELPFDLSDEDVVCIFGFGKFTDFADLSYGC